ncbi:MAG: hypothetical protein M3O36_18055 [Myxococcota bacterium]|nr:hypothetical protein [Myxococcota bacterium]
MQNSSPRSALVLGMLTALAAWTRPASAQEQVKGFAVDRLYLSAPGGGWFVMDTLDMHGGLGGAASLTAGYAHNPLRVRTADGAQRLTVVSDEALATFGVAATYDRFRLYLDLDMPLDVDGQGGVVGGYRFSPPNSGQRFTPSGVTPGTAPDTFSDARIGFDVRLLGSCQARFRLGAGAQALVPSPNTDRSSYLTDGSYHAMARVLFAGDIGLFTYAGHLGVHIRPLDDSPAPGSPEGSELLFGAAGGARIAAWGRTVLVMGPEVFGATAVRSVFGAGTTALEGLLTGRLEGTGDRGPQLRFKLGLGGGIHPRFGAPEERLVVAVELFDHDARE